MRVLVGPPVDSLLKVPPALSCLYALVHCHAESGGVSLQEPLYLAAHAKQALNTAHN